MPTTGICAFLLYKAYMPVMHSQEPTYVWKVGYGKVWNKILPFSRPWKVWNCRVWYGKGMEFDLHLVNYCSKQFCFATIYCNSKQACVYCLTLTFKMHMFGAIVLPVRSCDCAVRSYNSTAQIWNPTIAHTSYDRVTHCQITGKSAILKLRYRSQFSS